jgi:hypothetical protein
MTTQLTVEEKTSIINQHLKNLSLSRYSIEISKMEASAVLTAEQMSGTSYDSQIAEIDSKISALTTELADLAE